MTTPPKKPTEVAKSQTAVAKLEPWPTQQKVKDLARRLDRYYRHLEAMMKVDERLGEANDYTRKRIIQEAERVLDEFEMMGCHHSLKSGRLQKEWDECCPDSWRPEDSDHPVYSEVARMITVLMGSFPTSKIPEPEIFVRVLMDDVMALDPSFVEMESTCRELRKTKKFMPSVSEVIEELEEQKELWVRRSDVVWHLEEWYDDLRPAIARAKVAEEAILARKKAAEEAAKAAEEARMAKVKAIADRMAAKSQPIVVGDRVHNWRAGAGTVTALVPLDDGVMHYRVRFDASTERNVPNARYLERLVAGDVGFEPPAVPMIEHRKDEPMTPIASPTVPLDANGDKVGVPVDRSSETRNGEDD